MPIRVLVVEDQKLMIEGLRRMLESRRDIEIVGEASNGYEALQSAEELAPDIILMDIAMPDMNGIEATQRILKAQPDMKILGLSVHEDMEHIRKMVAAGAHGYLIKEHVFNEIQDAIEALYRDEYYFDSSVLPQVLEDYSEHVQQIMQKDRRAELTSREREILQLIAEGYTTKRIAAKLDVSVSTVESHRYNLSHKLDIHSIAGLTRYAIQQGIISP